MAEDKPSEEEDKAPDPQAYDGREKEVYDLYVEEKGAPPPDDWVKLYAKKKYATDDFIRADLKGYIRYEFIPDDKEKFAKAGGDPATYDGKGHWLHIYSQKAVDQMGGKIDLSNLAGGTEVFAPQGSVTGKNFKALDVVPQGARSDLVGLQQFLHTGQPDSGGIVGSILGKDVASSISNAIPDPVQALWDVSPMGFLTDNQMVLGAEGARDSAGGWRMMIGESAGSKVARYTPGVKGALVKTGAALAAPVTGGASLAAIPAWDLSQAQSARMAGAKVSWRDTIKNSAIDTGVAAAGWGLGELASGASAAAQGSKDAVAAARVANNAAFLATTGRVGAQATGTLLKGGTGEEALKGAAAGLVSAGVGGNALTQAATAAGTSYALGDGPDRMENALLSAGFSALQSGVSSAASGGKAKPAKMFDTSLTRPFTTPVDKGGGLATTVSEWRNIIRKSQLKPVDLSGPRNEFQVDSAEAAARYMNQEWNPDETL